MAGTASHNLSHIHYAMVETTEPVSAGRICFILMPLTRQMRRIFREVFVRGG